jgi:transposase-like protein
MTWQQPDAWARYLAEKAARQAAERAEAEAAGVRPSIKRPSRPPLSREKRERIVRMVREGMSYAQIARTLGIGLTTVKRWRGTAPQSRQPNDRGGRMPRVTAEQLAQIRQLALSGSRVVDIAAEVQRHPSTVYQALRRMQVTAQCDSRKGPRDGTLERVREWMALREQGMSWADIAREYGCEPENVCKLCQRWGHMIQEASS